MSKHIKSIATVYNGYHFRSRLEGRWAVFFDSLGVEYEYEPEGYEMINGVRYLPDFKLKCYGTRGNLEKEPFDLYVEVKGEMTKLDALKIKSFVYGEDGEIVNRLLVVGNIPPHGITDDSSVFKAYEYMGNGDIYPFNYKLIDGDVFAAYPTVHDGKFFLNGDDSNYIRGDIDLVKIAYDNARMMRFGD